MNDALFYETKVIPCEVIPYQHYTEIRWTLDPWANRYAIYKMTDTKRLLGHATGLGFYHDRSNEAFIGDYEIVAERIGDISFADGNIQTLEDGRLDGQDMMMRMESSKGDWKHHPDLGADLSRFNGYRNNAQTGKEIEEAIQEGCLYEGRFEDIEVRVVPTAMDRLSIYCFTGEAVAMKEVEL